MNTAFDRQRFEAAIFAADSDERVNELMAALDKHAMSDADLTWVMDVLDGSIARTKTEADQLAQYGRVKFRLGVEPTSLHLVDDLPPEAA